MNCAFGFAPLKLPPSFIQREGDPEFEFYRFGRSEQRGLRFDYDSHD